jgi:hypothetical protein
VRDAESRECVIRTVHVSTLHRFYSVVVQVRRCESLPHQCRDAVTVGVGGEWWAVWTQTVSASVRPYRFVQRQSTAVAWRCQQRVLANAGTPAHVERLFYAMWALRCTRVYGR